MRRLAGAGRAAAASGGTGGRAAALARSLRCAAGGLLLAFAALLALPPQAQAQTVETLVSNTGQTAGDQNGLVGTIAGSNWLAGQGFTTGDNTDGYTLSSVQLYIKYFDASDVVNVSIYSSVSDNPGSSLYVLTSPASIVNERLNTFTAPANATLEKDTEYIVVVEASGGGWFGVTDEEEPPRAPAAPGVAKVRGSVTSLKVSWRAPDNAGRPAIAHYDLRYRAGATGRWRNGPQGETGTSATIAGLVQNTEYQVQVRAANADGDGAWSAFGRGTPGVEEARRGELRLVDDSGPTVGGAGRLEVFYRGEWGTVCDDRFASKTFKVYAPLPSTPPPYETRESEIVRNVAPQLACELMGYSTGEVVSRGHLGMSVLPEPEDGGAEDLARRGAVRRGVRAGRAAPVLPRGRGAGELHPRGGRAPALLSFERSPGRADRGIPAGARISRRRGVPVPDRVQRAG